VASDWFVRFRPSAAATLRLFCFPYAGGGAAVFRPWSQELPAHVDVCAFQLPGREARFREPPLSNLGQIVEAALAAMRRQLDLPFAVFGHSMGSVIAFEVSRRIEAAGLPAPLHVWLSARRAPGHSDPDPPLRHLDDDAFVDALDRRYGGIPAAVRADRELMSLLLPGLRADIAALETHALLPEPRLACPLTVFGGSTDPRAPVAQLDGWRVATTDRFRLRVFDGDHFYLVPRRAEVLGEIARELESASAVASRPEPAS
jgi:medium-chain acyl-[acyl-carrier-protein] hydrolase